MINLNIDDMSGDERLHPGEKKRRVDLISIVSQVNDSSTVREFIESVEESRHIVIFDQVNKWDYDSPYGGVMRATVSGIKIKALETEKESAERWIFLTNEGLQDLYFNHDEGFGSAVALRAMIESPGHPNEIFESGGALADISPAEFNTLLQDVIEESTGERPEFGFQPQLFS